MPFRGNSTGMCSLHNQSMEPFRAHIHQNMKTALEKCCRFHNHFSTLFTYIHLICRHSTFRSSTAIGSRIKKFDNETNIEPNQELEALKVDIEILRYLSETRHSIITDKLLSASDTTVIHKTTFGLFYY